MGEVAGLERRFERMAVVFGVGRVAGERDRPQALAGAALHGNHFDRDGALRAHDVDRA